MTAKSHTTDMALVMAIDQGTSSTRCIVFNSQGQTVASSRYPVTLQTPRPGWVEMDAEELVDSVEKTMSDAFNQLNSFQQRHLVAIGLTNQRETTVAWYERRRAIAPAISWMDQRTAAIWDVEKQQDRSLESLVARTTGLRLVPYFSAGKMQWLWQNFCGTGDSLKKLHMGTIDAWLLDCLTGEYCTDITNAHRSLLVDIQRGQWSSNLLNRFNIRQEWLPRIQSFFPTAKAWPRIIKGPIQGLPITAVMGDQQSALLGTGCEEAGSAKVTIGTGTFVLISLGQMSLTLPIIQGITDAGLLLTVAASDKKQPHNETHCSEECTSKIANLRYAVEIPLAVGGATIEWARELFIQKSSKLGIKTTEAFENHQRQELDELLALEPPAEDDELLFIPHLSGALAPTWDSSCRGSWTGLSLGNRGGHLLWTVVESVVFSIAQALQTYEGASPLKITRLVVDGGLSASKTLLQLLADVMRRPVIRSRHREATAWGVARLAAVNVGLIGWGGDMGKETREEIFHPSPNNDLLLRKYHHWLKQYEKTHG